MHGLSGLGFWARGPDHAVSGAAAALYRPQALDQGLCPGAKPRPSSLPPAVVGKAFRAQTHSRHWTYGTALALTASQEVSAGIHSHFIDG